MSDRLRGSGSSWAFWLIALLLVLLVIVAISLYVFQFHNSPLSQDPVDWANFGDYFGWLNPFITIINILAIIWIFSTEKESQELPKLDIQINLTSKRFWVLLRNYGNGPAILRSCKFYDKSGVEFQIYDVIKKHLPDTPGTFWSFDIETVIRAGQDLELLDIPIEGRIPKGINPVIEEFGTSNIKIEFEGLYGHKYKFEQSLKYSIPRPLIKET